MNGFIRFSMNKVAAMLILIALLFGSGLYSAASLKVENIPDVSFPIVMIATTYPAPPLDVMEEVTKPIEDKVSNMQGLDTLSSTSSDNVSNIILQFTQGVDTDKMKQEIESLLQDVMLPQDATARVLTFGFASIPAYYLSVYAEEGMTQAELNKLYADEIEPGLTAMNGIDHIDSIGVQETSLDILLHADALSSFGLTTTEVTNVLQGALTNGSAGSVEFDGNSQMARVKGDLNSLYGLENLELTTSAGQLLLLKDVADIEAVNESEFVSRLDNQPAIGINLYKTSEANAVDFSNETNALLSKWEQSHPDIAFKKIYDSADEVRKSISGILKEGLIGVVLAAVMILLFLRNVRMTVIVLVSIPLSILITLILMSALDITLNIMTLGGMFIAIGRIVDDSIVVIENIYSNLEKAQERNESVILMATKQVAMAITSSTLVTAGVFLPLAFVTGIVGEIFRPFALTVSSALLASLVVALTVIPMLTKLMVLRGNKLPTVKDHSDNGKLADMYKRILNWCLSNRKKTLLASFVMFIASIIIIVPNLAVNFLSGAAEDRQMNFEIKLPYETSLESTDLQTQQIESIMLDAKDENGEPLFTFIQSMVGYNGSDEQVAYTSRIITEVNSEADPEAVKEQYTNTILSLLPQGSEVTAGSLAGGGGGFQSTGFSYSLQGEDQSALEQAAALVKEKMVEFPELSEIEDSLSDAKTEVSITVSQSKARELGLSAAQVREAVRTWISKQQLGDIRFDNVLYSTTVELTAEDKNSLARLGKLPLMSASAGIVYLNEVAKLEEVQAPVSLQRESKVQVVKVTAAIDSANETAVSAKVLEALRALDLPDGVTTEVQGVSMDIAESFSQLFLAMGVAIAIVYFIMVLCFGNAGTPFAILFSLPLAVIGGLLGLLVSNEAINVTSLIGFMMLIGIVVTNAIVLLDRAQQLRAEGFSARHALIEAGAVRLRPIIMTAVATIAAMIPLAFGAAEGSLISKGLAVVVIGGLTTSTLLTLVVVPVIYEILESIKDRLFRKSAKAGKPAAQSLEM